MKHVDLNQEGMVVLQDMIQKKKHEDLLKIM